MMPPRMVVLAFRGALGYPGGRVNSVEETRKVEITESAASNSMRDSRTNPEFGWVFVLELTLRLILPLKIILVL